MLEKLRQRFMPARRPSSRAFTLPGLVLEIQPSFVAGTRLHGSGRAARRFERMSVAELERGALQGALNRPNVSVIEPLHQTVHDVVEAVGNGNRRVGLLIPDASARVGMLGFEALPGDAREAEALVRWRMKDVLPFSPEEATVSYQVTRRSQNSIELLAVAAKSSVLAEYESALERIDISPVLVLPATVALLPLLPADDGAAQLLVHVCAGSVTAVVVAGGGIRLWRSRQLSSKPNGGSNSIADEIAAEIARVVAGSGDYLRVEISGIWLCARPPADAELGPELARRISHEVKLLWPENDLGSALPEGEHRHFKPFGATVAGLVSNLV